MTATRRAPRIYTTVILVVEATSPGRLQNVRKSARFRKDSCHKAMRDINYASKDTDLEMSLFLDVIIAHMAFVDAQDLSSQAEAHAYFVDAVRVLHAFLTGSVNNRR
jgi:hypothetical protein